MLEIVSMTYLKNNENTKEDLRTALLQLMNNYYFDKITVSMLCEKTGVNRSTFYYHYSDLDDLLYDAQEEYFKELGMQFDLLEKYEQLAKRDNLDKIIAFLVDLKNSKDNKFKLFLEKGEPLQYYQHNINYFFNVFQINDDTELSKRYRAFSYFSNSFQLVSAWIINGYDLDEKELADMIFNLEYK